MSAVSLVAPVFAPGFTSTAGDCILLRICIWLFLVVAALVSAGPPVVVVSAGPLVVVVSAGPLVALPGVCRAQ